MLVYFVRCLAQASRLCFAVLVLGLGSSLVSAQPSFVLLSDPAELSSTSIYPNGTWATTPYENEAVLNDDWTFGGASGVPVSLHWAFSPGTTFGAASATVTWDETALALDAVDGSTGLFLSPDGVVLSSALATSDGVVMDAALLTIGNGTSAAGDHVARLGLRVLRPGFSPLAFSSALLREYDGSGGQTDVPVSTVDAAVRAYLGDVAADTGGGAGDPTSGDGNIDFEDVVVFTQGYFAGTAVVSGSLADYKAKLDIGPTTDGTPLTQPQSDLQIEFEDLVVFAISYAYSQAGVYPSARAAVSPAHVLVLPARFEGGDLVVPIRIEGAADLRAVGLDLGLSQDVSWAGAVGAADGFAAGADRQALVLSQEKDGQALLDAAVLSGATINGDQEVAYVRVSPADDVPASAYVGRTDLVQINGARLRTSANMPVAAIIGGVTTGVEEVDASESLSLSVSPNPASGPVTVALHLPTPGPVRVSVFDTLGRLISTPFQGDLSAGHHAFTWTPASVSGTYFVVANALGRREAIPLSITR